MVELIAAYWRFVPTYYVKDGKRTPEVAAIKCALRHVRELYGREPAAAFGPLALKAVRSRMLASGMSRRVINQNVGRIRRMFRWAASEQLILADVHQALMTVDGLRKGKTEARELPAVGPVDDPVIDQTILHLPRVVADMVRLQRLTGMRPGEVCCLRPADLDRSGVVWTYRPTAHKTEHHGRDRVISLGPKAQQLLSGYLVEEPESPCFAPARSEAQRRAQHSKLRRTPLSCGNRPGTNRKQGERKRPPGNAYTPNSYRRAIHRVCDSAELARWSPNQLRHAAATTIRRKFGLEAAQVVLGHAAADVTQVYAERDQRLAERVALEVG